ncbi:MAG TPA: tetratricopeptide repeat protein, partial [Candidatus Handelsmanbacteria bacterium]|nr:tetratricopeptide repeat protein [Candidatus Handelsmanbacteria bacterium]
MFAGRAASGRDWRISTPTSSSSSKNPSTSGPSMRRGHRLTICLVVSVWFFAGCTMLDPPEETTVQLRERLQQEEMSYRQKIQQDPQDATPHIELGDVLLEQSRFDEALTAYGAALDLDPNQASAFLGMGNVLFCRGDSERAIAAYQRSIAIDPENVDAYRKLADVYLGARRYIEAQQALDSALAM